MDFLFAKDRNPWVFMDKEATKVGAIFERDMDHGEAFTAFDEKTLGAGQIEIEGPDDLADVPIEPKEVHVAPGETV
jgi:hypothetical protein